MKIKNIVMLAGTLVAGLLFAEPQPYSFLKNFKGGWDRRKPVEFITEADGSRILKLGGSDDYKMRGSLDIKNIDKALEAFRGYLPVMKYPSKKLRFMTTSVNDGVSSTTALRLAHPRFVPYMSTHLSLYIEYVQPSRS